MCHAYLMAKLVEFGMELGVIAGIFTRSNLVLAYNITKMDWNLFSDAIKQLDSITTSVIKKDI